MSESTCPERTQLLEERKQPVQITNLEIRRWHIGAARPTITVHPRDLQTGRLRALDIVHVAVADMQNLMGRKPQLVQSHLEHPLMRFVGPHGFRDQDELHRQGEVPGRDVLVIGIVPGSVGTSVHTSGNICAGRRLRAVHALASR